MTKMKQAFPIFLSLLVLAAAFGCAAKKAVQINVDALAAELASSIKYNDSLSKLEEKPALKLYNMQNISINKQTVYVSSGATAEEISVWEAKDANSAKDVKAAVLAHIETQKTGFQDYVPTELTKLKNPVLICEGNYVILCVSNDNTKAKQVIDSYLKQ